MNWKWIIFGLIFLVIAYGTYIYVKNNGWIDILAGIFILFSAIFFGGLLMAILNEGKK